MFDLSDLTNDLNEFQNFYKSGDLAEYNPTERPENPFHKNFFESDFKENIDGKRGFEIKT
jgi:hypothetical protein